MKTKVYFAKSNRANPDHVMAVRDTLSKFDIEIVEFKGGTYSHKPLLGCEILIVLPEIENNEWDKEFPLGKGLHEQIFAFNNLRLNECDLMIISDVCEYDGPVVSKFDSIEPLDDLDYVNYSMLMVRDELGPLSEIMSNRVGGKIACETKRRLLLITGK